MRPPLIVGLGNPLAGDDGVGWQLAGLLRQHPGLPADVEVLQTYDLLTLQEELEDRSLVLLVDALLDDGACGRLIPIDDFSALETRTGSVHHLPPAQAIALLRGLYEELRQVPIVLLGVTVQRAALEHGLSAPLVARLDDLADEILAFLEATASRLPSD